MKHFEADFLTDVYAVDNGKYIDIFNQSTSKRLPSSFLSQYEKLYWMHDWYFDDLLIANTDKLVKGYSKKRKETVQLGFFSGDGKKALMIYKNVDSIDVSFEETDDVARFSPNGFGRCLTSYFDIADEKSLWHGLLFEGGTIELRFEKISMQMIRVGL